MGKTRNLNGDVKEENTKIHRHAQKKRKMFRDFIRRIETEEDDEVFVDEERGERKMKKASKLRTVLLIPGFRKNKKTHINVSENEVLRDEMTPFNVVDVDSASFLFKSSDNSHLVLTDSVRTSISSLDTLVSVDSGISSTGSLSSIESISSVDEMKGKDPESCGRAPIASPEDDLLTEDNNVPCIEKLDSDEHNNSAASFCTLSDNSSCSCDSCASDSESEAGLQETTFQSDSDSDLDSGSRHRQHSESDTDSESDDDQSFFMPTKCSNSSAVSAKTVNSDNSKLNPLKKLSRSNSRLNLSLKKLVRSGSKLDLSLKKIMKSGRKSNKKKAGKSESEVKVPELQSSPKRVMPKRPPVNGQNVSILQKENKSSLHSSTPMVNSSISSLKDISALSSINSCDVTLENSWSCDSLLRTRSDSVNSGSTRGRSGITLGNSIKSIKLQRSKSDCSTKSYSFRKPSLNSSQPLDERRTQRQQLNNSPALQVRSRSIFQDNCDIDIDTCKSPMEVRQAMEKTAFWIENNDYDKTPDVSSTESLLQTSRDVTESDLCNQIIGIYFGEEDSDSSLSSSCLDSSMETLAISDENTVPATSTPLETNLDDFTMATFVPAPYQMAEAKTRKISNMSKAEPVSERQVKTESIKECEKEVLKEHNNNSVNKCQKLPCTAPASELPCQKRKPKMLSEEEIDTITKIHTICNGQRTVQYLDLNDIPVNFKHYPPPKRASKVVWNNDLCCDEAIHHTPPRVRLPVQTKPILQQKPKDFTYPYQEDQPSPIVITKVRRSKSMPRKSREWPW